MNQKIVHPGLVVLFSLITCGIYSLFWIARVSSEIQQHHDTSFSPALDVMLSIITCGIWFIYLSYRYPSIIDDMNKKDGYEGGSDIKILCLVLSIFGLGIISMAIIQNELNNHWKRHLTSI